jgi:NarL family two-component system sensor histidine kinase LiaS
MAATVRTWSRGDLTAAVDQAGRDELAGLATDLNLMAEQLHNLLAARRDIARAEERHNVRRELHDGVKQDLFAAALHLAAARASLDPVDAATSAHLADADRCAHRAQGELTAIMDSQAPPSLAGGDLPAALQALADDFAGATGFPLELSVPSQLVVDDATAQALYRVSQEAVANIRRHARASVASLTLGSSPSGYDLTVVDNGIGLGDDAYSRGFGLSSIRDRVVLAGGRLDIDSDPGGTRLTVHLPPDD